MLGNRPGKRTQHARRLHGPSRTRNGCYPDRFHRIARIRSQARNRPATSIPPVLDVSAHIEFSRGPRANVQRHKKTMAVVIDAGSFALRPFCIDAQHNEFVNYEAITFPEHPKAGCDMYLRRVALFGLVEDGDGPLGIDVLAENGDILHTFTITRGGFEYLRRSLRFRVDRNVTTHSTGETR